MIIAGSRFGSPVGVLDDGTPFYAPIGEVIVDGSLVTCHLCGRSLRSVTAHLRVHGWTKQAYCDAFGLERGQSLEGPETRKLRAAALASRLVFDPAMRQGSAAGRDRARSGDLTRDAARAARGRRMPEQRRRKADELRSRAVALHEAADQRMQRSAEVEAATDRRLRRGISTTIPDVAYDERRQTGPVGTGGRDVAYPAG